MPEEKFIQIDKIKVEKEKLNFRISFSNNLKNYLLQKDFYVKYDIPIQEIDNSILNIPGVSSLAAISWVTGSVLIVDELDSCYVDSLDRLKGVFKKFYPNLKLKGNLYVKKRRVNQFNNNRSGLLFSGGIDSTCSFIKRNHAPPVLYTIIGGTIPVNNYGFIHNLKKVYHNLAKNKKTKIHFIETNLRDIVNESLLSLKLRKHIYEWSWWEAFNMALVQLSLCAPLSVNEINRLIISSSNATSVEWMPYGSDILIDEKISWGNIKIIHDDYNIERQGKIRKIIKPDITHNKIHPFLQVCNYYPIISNEFNCGYCGKCVMTIIGLLIENIDPVKCGFPIVDGLYEHLKHDIFKGKLLAGIWRYWKNIIENLEIEKIHGYYGSREFLTWLEKLDLNKMRDTKNRSSLETRMLKIQTQFPKIFHKTNLKVYYKWKYHKHKLVECEYA